MFSKEYFTYLFKSKKYLLIFILLIAFLNAVGSGDNEIGMVIQGFLCVILTYLIPCNVFSYVHDKKAVDTYFSIPVSRKTLLVTGILFCVIVAYVPFVVTFSFFSVAESIGILNYVLALIKILLVAFTLVVFNTCLYLIGNNIFDGAVMIGAYTVLPAVLYTALQIFADSYIAGGGFDMSFVAYLSPLTLSTDLFFDIMDASMLKIHNITALIAHLTVFAYLLYRSYVDRAVERASTPSTKAYSYPLVIYLYVFLILFMISSTFNYGYSSLGHFMSDMFIVYLMLFVVYVVAYFVYKRKLYFSYKLPLVFIMAAILTLGFSTVARKTKGFGLAQAYDHNDRLGRYTLYSYMEQIPSEITESLKQIEGVDANDTYLYAVISCNEEKEIKVPRKEISEDSLALFEKYRASGIDYFYKAQKEGQNSNLNILSSDKRYYYYGIKESVAYKDMLEFAKDPAVTVILNNNSGEYELLPDGSLKLLTLYMDTVTYD